MRLNRLTKAFFAASSLTATLLAAPVFSANPAQPTVTAPIKIGAVGDSMTDEYLDSGTNANTDIAAYNWVEILGALRADYLNFGEYRGNRENGWPDHRAAGYQFNYAKVAATASKEARMSLDFWITTWDMPIDGSAVGSRYVEDQVTAILEEPIEYAVVAAGSNDYFFKTHDFSLLGTPNRNNEDTGAAFNLSISEALLNHVDRLKAKGVKVMLAYIPMGTAGGADETVLNAIATANRQLKAGAKERDVPMVKLFDFEKTETGGIKVGELEVELTGVAKKADLVPQGSGKTGKCRSDGLCAGPTHKTHFIADDELHPNTTVQAMIANQVIKAFNANYGMAIPLLSDEEILKLTETESLR